MITNAPIEQAEAIMNIYDFMSNSPFLTFFLALFVAEVAIRLPNRVLRHWNIRKYGYPPAHCDADGDFKKED